MTGQGLVVDVVIVLDVFVAVGSAVYPQGLFVPVSVGSSLVAPLHEQKSAEPESGSCPKTQRASLVVAVDEDVTEMTVVTITEMLCPTRVGKMTPVCPAIVMELMAVTLGALYVLDPMITDPDETG